MQLKLEWQTENRAIEMFLHWLKRSNTTPDITKTARRSTEVDSMSVRYQWSESVTVGGEEELLYITSLHLLTTNSLPLL